MGVSENRGTLLWGPYNKDPTFLGTILGSPIFGNSHIDGPEGACQPTAGTGTVFVCVCACFCVFVLELVSNVGALMVRGLGYIFV